MQTLIHHVTLVLPDRIIENGWLLIEDERILDLGPEPTCPTEITRAIHGGMNFLLPGLIDLHCDAIEKQVEPRPNVHIDIHTALQEADLRLAGVGITSEFHAVSLDDNEFGVRSDSFLHELYQAIRAQSDENLIRHKIHTRLELSSERGNRIIEQIIGQGISELISMMDHSPGQGQYPNVESFRKYVARTTHRSGEEIDEILELKRQQASHIPERIEHVARLVRNAGLALATHDDDRATKVEQWPALDVSISEFPTTMEAARRAHELGLAVCMGAPNVLRGKSSGGHLSAIEAIRAHVVDALCSDYYPAAMLSAIFALVKQQLLTLPAATCLVTLNPARAVRLQQNYGSLEVGKIADLLLVKRTQQDLPRVLQVFVGGREKFRIADATVTESNI